MKNTIITAIALVTLAFASCTKSDIKPETKGFEVELIHGSNVLVTTTDTNLNIIAPNGMHKVSGNNLRIYNLSNTDAAVVIGNTVRKDPSYRVPAEGFISYQK